MDIGSPAPLSTPSSPTPRYFPFSEDTWIQNWREVIGWGKAIVYYVTGASNWDWLKFWKACYPCKGKGRRGMFLFLFLHSFIFHFLLPSHYFISSTLFYLFSLSLGDDTKWPTRVDVLLNPNTINQKSKIGKIHVQYWNVQAFVYDIWSPERKWHQLNLTCDICIRYTPGSL